MNRRSFLATLVAVAVAPWKKPPQKLYKVRFCYSYGGFDWRGPALLHEPLHQNPWTLTESCSLNRTPCSGPIPATNR